MTIVLAMLCHNIGVAQTQQDSTYNHKKEFVRMLGVGAADVLDTYLSPEKYRGTELRFVFQDNRQLRWTGMTQTMLHQATFASVNNRANTGTELCGEYNFQYLMRYNWKLTPHLLLAAGGGADLNLGFLYNTRNGNNPVQVRASLNLAPSVLLRYDFNIRRCAFRLGYESMVPAVGVMFSPNYGQSYYEIFDEGDDDHNIVLTTTATTPSLRQMLSLDFRPVKKWKRSWLRVGYIGDYQQSHVNHLKYHHYSHLFMIGWVKGM